MKLYKVNWSIKYYIPGSALGMEGTLQSKHKYTLDKNKAEQIVKGLEQAATLLGITKELRTSIEEEDIHD